MKLEWKHLPLMLMGGAIGFGFGWLASFMFKPGILPEFEFVVGIHGTGGVFGAIAGIGFSVAVIVAKAARDPNVSLPRNFTRINGTGSTLLGYADVRDDGSYVATEWFTVLWIPVFPVCRYRLTEHYDLSTPFSGVYTLHEKMPPLLKDVARVYGLVVSGLLVLIGLGWLVFRS